MSQRIEFSFPKYNANAASITSATTSATHGAPVSREAHAEASLLDGWAPAPLENCEVFDSIRSKMCLIYNRSVKCSGFFVNERGLLVTTSHGIVEINRRETETEITMVADISNLRVYYEGREYEVEFAPDIDPFKAEFFDLCLLQIRSPGIKTTCFDLLSPSIPLKEGTETYFAGYPLTQSVITFHKGIISSFYQEKGAQYFTIDGTVVPGNSGGPVVIQHQRIVYLAGIIFAEAADVNPDFLAQKNGIIRRLKDATVNVSGVPLNLILAEAVNTIFKNMSTGIGKAVHVQHIGELLTNQTQAYYLLGPEQPSEAGTELFVHGTLNAEWISEKHLTVQVPRRIVQAAIEFIRSFDTPEKKADFYSKLWGSTKNIYEFEGGRLDRQPPPDNASNLHIQVEDKTIATVVVSNELSGYTDPAKMAEVVNYVVRQFVRELQYFQTTNIASVRKIVPKADLVPV